MQVAGGARAVFLYRDGVLVVPTVAGGRSYAPRSLEAYRFYPEAPECLDRLKRAGFMLIVVTNQPDVGAGLVSREVVDEMHRRLAKTLPVDAIKACFHTGRDGCPCRKPAPGMLLEAADDFGIDLGASFMVGDRASDVAAGRSAGCRTLLIDLGLGEGSQEADWVVRSLGDATTWILSRARGERVNAQP
jgi:D-glycero-D-manno-heptose 1,7-bisphosphate phosphatase